MLIKLEGAGTLGIEGGGALSMEPPPDLITLVSAEVNQATTNVLSLEFDDVVTITHAGWTVTASGGAVTVDVLIADGETDHPKLLLSRAIAPSEVITVSYDGDAEINEVVDLAVTNNVHMCLFEDFNSATIDPWNGSVTNPDSVNLLIRINTTRLEFYRNTDTDVANSNNYWLSTNTYTRGTVAFLVARSSGFTNSYGFGMMYKDANNYAQFYSEGGIMKISIVVSGAVVYSYSTGFSSLALQVKITYDSSNRFKFYYHDVGGWIEFDAGVNKTYNIGTTWNVKLGATSNSADASGILFSFDLLRVTDVDYSTALPEDQFLPSVNVAYPTSVTAKQTEYLSWRVAWFVHPSLILKYLYGDARLEMAYNYDWETFADQAVAAGNVDAVSCHVISNGGFTYFESRNRSSPATYGSTTFPQWGQDYGVQHTDVVALGVTADCVYQFVKAFRSRGIKIGFYIMEGAPANIFDGQKNPSAGDEQNWVEYLCREAKWLNALYAPDYYWIDWPYVATLSSAQRNQIYQALKTPHEPLIIHNAWTGGTTYRTFPCDVMHIEYPAVPIGESWFNPIINIGGVDYYVPKGLSYSGLYSQTISGGVKSVTWSTYDLDEYPGGDLDLSTHNNIRTQAEFNTYYKFCVDRGLPFFVNMSPLNNAFQATYLSRVDITNLDAS